MEDLAALRVLVCIARELSLVGAAGRLGISPAAVSRHLADLEAHLGVQLVCRNTRRLSLTEIGERYVQRARLIIAQLDEADAQVRDESGRIEGGLLVLAPSSFATSQLVRHMQAFRAEFPRVTLHLSVTATVTATDEHFDVCVLMVDRPLPDSGIVARPLADSEIVCCASPRYLDRRGRPGQPNELERHDVVLPHNLRREVQFTRVRPDGLAAATESVTVTLPAAAFESNDITLNHAATLAGLGIAGLPSFMVADAVRAGLLERVLPEWHVQRLRLFAAVPARRYLPARTRAFIEYLCSRFGARDADPWLASMTAPRPPG